MRTDYLDLVQLYNPNPSDPKLSECIDFLDKKNFSIIK